MSKELRYEDGVIAFEALKKEIKSYGKSLSEADTRCKIIDEILKKCLGWKEKDIKREKYVNKGYIDYILRVGNKGLIVEAKRSHPLFELPAGVDFSSRLTIGNLLKKEESLEQHYNQVLQYCFNASIQFGCFTNGLEWVIFPAIRIDGINIPMSKVIVFKGLKEIEKNFANFWNLFSKESVKTEKINQTLLPEAKHIPPSYQVNDKDKKNLILNRNILEPILSPVLPEYFGDLIGPELLPKLEKCYVDSTTLHESTRDFRKLSQTVGEDPHVRQPYSRDKVYQDLDRSISTFIKGSGRSGILYILLGRVGCGKSTFLNHYFYIENKSILEQHFVYLLNWLEYDGQQNISDFFYEKIGEISKENDLFLQNSKFEILQKAFQQDINFLRKGPLGDLVDSKYIKNKISEHLIDLSNKKEYYYSRIFNYVTYSPP